MNSQSLCSLANDSADGWENKAALCKRNVLFQSSRIKGRIYKESCFNVNHRHHLLTASKKKIKIKKSSKVQAPESQSPPPPVKEEGIIPRGLEGAGERSL